MRRWCVQLSFLVKYDSFELVVDTAAQTGFTNIHGEKSLSMN